MGPKGMVSVANVKDRVTTAHRRAVEYDIADIAQFLQETLGQSLVAYLAGVGHAKVVAGWAERKHAPRGEAEQRLRIAFQVFHMLQEEDAPPTVRAWFVGLNPQLDDDSPANAIREGRFKDVLVAARAFLAGG